MELFRFPFTAMASPCELHLYASDAAGAERAAQAAIAEVRRIETVYSRYRDDSVVSLINRSAGGEPVTVDDETAALLDYAAAAFEQSDGLFDITSGVLRRVWDFKSGQLPNAEDVDACLDQIGWHKVEWQSPAIRLQAGMQLDFGGFGKEYAADRAASACEAQGITHGLVELGGDIRVVGPHPDGRPWQVGVRNPGDPERAIAAIPLSHGGLASSGDYERCMVVDGVRYSHILDPRSGWPVTDTMAAVTTVAPLCLLAGTGATVAMLKGSAAAPRWLSELGMPHLWIEQDGRLGGSLVTGLTDYGVTGQ